MRHKVAGYKLGRNPAHRRSLLRNLVTSLIIEERIETTVPKAKAAYLMTSAAVDKLFDAIGPRFGDRNGGYLRIVRTGWRKGDGADNAFIELLGSEKVLDEKRQKRTEARSKRAAENKRAMDEAEAQGGVEHPTPGAEGEDKT
jgi:large subunit ribosomal protein L17